jgi:hypothetical protein
MFDSLFKKRRPEVNEDPTFGQLTFVEAMNPRESFWEGCGRFSPIDSDVTYWIKAGNAGPSESHRNVYRSIESRYSELLPLVTPLLHREYAAGMAGSDVPLGQPTFSLDIVHVPEVESDSMEWSLEFFCDQWDDALFAVQMKGWQPTGEISVMD